MGHDETAAALRVVRSVRTISDWKDASPPLGADDLLERRVPPLVGLSLLPAPAPAAPVAPTAVNQPQDHQKDNSPNEGVQDQRNNSHPEVNPKSRQQPITDKCADQTNQQITDQSKSTTLHHPTCQPSGNNTNNNDNQETLIGQVHDRTSEREDRWLMPIVENSSNYSSAFHSIASSVRATSRSVLGARMISVDPAIQIVGKATCPT
jgi:hypothetical protein